jgi:hypothetical protein
VLDEAPAKVEVITAEGRAAGLLKADINKDKPFREAKKALGIKSCQPDLLQVPNKRLGFTAPNS